MPVAACADPAVLRVSKTIVGVGANGANAKEVTLSDEDTVTFAISVTNVGGKTVLTDIVDSFDTVFTGTVDVEDNPDGLVTWTRTGPTGTVTTGVGDISETNTSIAAGQSVTYLVEAIYSPTACTSLTVNVVTATKPGDNCCHEDEVSDWAKVYNADGPSVKLDPTEGFTAMEVLYHFIENAALADKVAIAKFINACGTLADVVGADGTPGDGVAVPILDVFGDPTGLYAETSAGS